MAEDDEYRGYYIPAKTAVIGNMWAVLHDEAVYPQPDEFIPERFLDETGTKPVIPGDTHSLGHSSFGFGRRSVNHFSLSDNLFTKFRVDPYC